MNLDSRNFTLIHADEDSSWIPASSESSASSTIVVANWNAFTEAMLVGAQTDHRVIERAIIDRTIDCATFLEFLAALPVGFGGDVLYIENDARAYLSAGLPREGRTMYVLTADDVQFYREVHRLDFGRRPEAVVAPMPQVVPLAPPSRAVDCASRIVLIGDDDRRARAVLAELAIEEGCEVVYACDGTEAIRLAAQLRPALVFLDGLMPAMHGFEVARFIRNFDPAYSPTIAVVSGVYKSLRYRNEALLKYGVDMYFTKPIDPEMIRTTIRDVFGSVALAS
ncbi:MAG: response regulator [Acidobacteria bacterium]|nr:response regulator [Acidobacteriota bacterium]MBV9477918.1 response regulator [Acidobacteriota bacterium]